VNDADKDRVRGEALFIRGVTYFELVKLFALPYSAGNTSTNLGIPIVLTPTRGISDSSYVSRKSVDETYAQIIADLTTAEALVPSNTSVPENNGIYATKRAAAGYLSRVYLQMGRYAEARDAANRAINYGGKSLVTPYIEAFNKEGLSAEDIFVIEVNDQDGSNDMHLFYSIPDHGGRDGDVAVNPKHMNFYEALDQRFDQFYPGNGDTRTAKWRDLYSNLPIIRLAELYLTRAEANFRLGTSIGDTPLNDVNRIRARVGLLPKAALTLDDIILERKLELAHEGQAIHDVKRLLKTVDGLPFNSPRLVFPIPISDINANHNLEQNAGY
jgi:tetratricopeptide (TPR) repeat protein